MSKETTLGYDEKDRMLQTVKTTNGEHICSKEEFIGEVKEFINNSKGLRGVLSGVVVAILLQVGAFLFLWGGLTTTVKNHDKSIDKILSKLDTIKIVGYAVAEEK